MNRIFLSILSVGAFALLIAGHASAGGANNPNSTTQNPTDNSSGVMIIESYTVSATPANSDMQPLPEDPGVEVAPLNDDSPEPIAVEEDITMQETSGNN
jgi:hypothetical protein